MPPENDPSQNGSNETPSGDAPDGSTPDIAKIVNSAVTAQLKRQLGKAVEDALKPFQEKLTALSTAPPPKADPDPKADPSKSPEYAALQQKIAEMEKKAEKAELARAAAETRQREDKAFSDLKSALQGKVRDEFLDLVAANLFKIENRVQFEEDGTPVFTATRSTAYGDEDLRLPIKDGVAHFLKSEEAKHFLPAPAPGGNVTPKPRNNGSQFQNNQFDPDTASDDELVRHSMAMEQQMLKAGIKL